MKNTFLPAVLVLLAAAMQSNAQTVVVGITEKVADIAPGAATGSWPRSLFNYDNHIYFSAENADGRELWKTDGSTAGTVQIKDLEPGANSSVPMYFMPFNSQLYFAATNGIWSTDGTTAGTQSVKNIGTFGGFFPYNSKLLFAGSTANGFELWTSDGTTAGTQELMDINPGVSDAYPGSFTPLGSKVVFSAFTDNSMNTYAPWITDGTVAGTQKLADINVLALAYGLYDYNGIEHSDFCEYNGEIYFSGDNGNADFELWKTDGTPSGTVLVKDIAPSPNVSMPHGFKVYNGKLYFAVSVGDPSIDGLWVTSGTAANTFRLAAGIAMGDGNVVEYAELAGDLYFIASGKVWKTDGTVSGTHALLGSPDDPHRLTVLNNKIYTFGTTLLPPAQFTLFSIDDLDNVFPVSMPMASHILPLIHADTMGKCIYFAAAPEATTNDIELYRFKDTTFIVGVNDVQATTAVDIYPNPATNSFSVKTSSHNKSNTVYVYSLSGQLLLRSDKTENINIAQLPAGIYTVQIISDGAVSVGKLRKE